MGSIVGCLASNAACCIGQAACSCCCKACPSCKNSTASRIGYAALLVGGSAAAALCRTEWVSGKIEMIPGVESDWVKEHCKESEGCSIANYVGILGVFRVCFAMVLFFLSMSLLMVGVTTSRDPRAGFQNGFWLFKIIGVAGFAVLSFFIPNWFFMTVYGYLALVGSFLFIILQLILLVDFAHTWSEYWVDMMEESESQGWFWLLLGTTVGLYTGALTMIIYMFVRFTHTHGCNLNKTFISLHLILALGVSALAISPPVQEANPRSGLLQSAVVIMYATYLVWSAVSNEPDEHCSSDGNFLGYAHATSAAMGTVFVVISIAYSSFKTGSDGAFDNVGMAGSEEADVLLVDTGVSAGYDDDEERGGQQVWDDEREAVAYNYSFFHVIFLMAALYISMLITNFASISGGGDTDIEIGRGWPAAWVKIVSSWCVMALYGWTLVAPILLPDRF
eukprot:Clim_evm24s206 gene=Clim_evmTU24s206